MRIALAALLLISCGGAPANKPPARLANAAPVAKVAKMSCADAGVLLRGPIDNEAPDAGPSRVASIEAACTEGTWGAEVLACVGDTVGDANACLDKLTSAQHEALDAKLIAWAEAHPVDAPDPSDDEAPWIDCEDGIGDVALYAPPITLTGDDQAWAVGMRRREVVRACNATWEPQVKTCFAAAKDGGAIATCEAMLPPEELNTLVTRFGELDALASKTLAARKQAPACKALVAQHYADARWKGKLVEMKAKERGKAIADSRKAMTEACTKGNWDATLRACYAVGGTGACGDGFYAWDYPADGVVAIVTGIPECDAYVGLMTKTQQCSKMPQASRDALRDAFAAISETFKSTKGMSPESKKAMGDGCKQGTDAITQMLSAMGC